MVQHESLSPKTPNRVVILGAHGFIGSALSARLRDINIPVLALGSKDIDLGLIGADQQLKEIINSNDSLVMLSAITPDKGRDMAAMMHNLQMGMNVCKAIEQCPVQQVIYLSSDAVYAPEVSNVTEATVAAPIDLYGAMHRTREIMFQTTVKTGPLLILRLTLTFGAADTHNSYGPNRFRRSAHQQKKITLFGNGEEMRDHIFVEDVIEVIAAGLHHRSQGILNLATGKSYSFLEIANKVASLFDYPVEIISTPRQSPITHRHYDVAPLYKAFPQIRGISLDEALSKVHHCMLETV